MKRIENRTRSLRLALLGNATFSVSSGICLAFASQFVSGMMGQVPAVLLMVIGWMLILFSVGLLLLTTATNIRRSFVVTACILDVAWVAATPVCCLIFRPYISDIGVCVMLVVALIVGVFALLQAVGFMRMTSEIQSNSLELSRLENADDSTFTDHCLG